MKTESNSVAVLLLLNSAVSLWQETRTEEDRQLAIDLHDRLQSRVSPDDPYFPALRIVRDALDI